MTDGKKQEEWVRFVKASVRGYVPWALVSVYESNGEKMLAKVLKRLGLEQTSTLIRGLADDEWRAGGKVGAAEIDSAGRIGKSTEEPPPPDNSDDKAPWE